MDLLASYDDCSENDSNADSAEAQEPSEEHKTIVSSPHAEDASKGNSSKRQKTTALPSPFAAEESGEYPDSSIHKHKTIVLPSPFGSSSSDSKTKQNKPSTLPPPPSDLLGLFEAPKQADDSTTDSSLHQGRKRSFPHVEGNWATHVYIPVRAVKEVGDLVQQVHSHLTTHSFSDGSLHSVNSEDYHISLSRTVAIREHHIPVLTEQLELLLKEHSSFEAVLGTHEYYTNEEHSRTFAGLCVLHANTEALIASVDAVFKDFRLQKYYENPSLHMTMAWALGDVIPQNEPLLEAEGCPFTVDCVECKIGKKIFRFPLR